MKKEDIICLPHENLRQKSKKVHIITEETKKIIDDMTSASLDWENSREHEVTAALAAVQINVLEKIVIVRSDFDDKSNRDFTILINPEIVKYEGQVEYAHEGCLSVGGGIYGNVPRHSKIRVKALSVDGREIKFKADGFLARVIQHEIDHTNGIVYIDHIKDDKKAFFKLDEQGELQPLNYEKEIAENSILWN